MKIYVGNLPYDTTAADLKKAFGKFGEVRKATIVQDERTGASLGFAHILMGNPSSGRKALTLLNNTEFMGRKLMLKSMS